jgi:hypothetical protein
LTVLIVYFPTRSVEMNLARRFNAGNGQRKYFRRVATPEVTIQPSLRDERPTFTTFPGVETPG